jgi:adenylyltransferase/sulfurtransferase
MQEFTLSDTPLDPAALQSVLRTPASGACATFEGWVRNHNEGRAVDALEYEAYPALAVSEGTRIIEEARRRFGLHEAACVHRTGALAIGDCAVWVGASSAHRDEAFRACRYIIDEVKDRVPIWKKEIYATGDHEWVRCDACAAHHHDHGHHHHAQDEPAIERAYYARHTTLPEIGAPGQDRLRQIRVLVVGAGALGCAVLPYLAGAGVGQLAICDDDAVALSNLHRQTLYAFTQEGQPKAQAAAERMRALNPFIEVRALPYRMTTANVTEILQDYDVIVDGTDNFEAHLLLNDTAVAQRKLFIHAALYQYEGQVFAWHPADNGPNLRALWPETPAPGTAQDCAAAGVLGPVTGTVGTLQATEVIKQILDLPGRLRGEMLVVDTLAHTTRRLKLPGAEALAPFAGLTDDPTCDLDDLPEYTLVDVRPEADAQSAPLHAADHVLPSDTTVDYHEALADLTGPVLLCCAEGRRSRILALNLRREGNPNVYALRGGITALVLRTAP